MRIPGLFAPCLGALLLSAGCVSRPPEKAPDPTPAQWHVPLPHGGAVVLMAEWWKRLDDPLLVDLISAAQAESPDIASAAARISEASADRVAAGAAMIPNLNGNLSAQRGNALMQASPGQTLTPMTMLQAGLASSWEIDLFGGLAASRDAAQAQLEGAQARWHAARVSVAAETANTYFDERACQGQLQVQASDTRSRNETARLTDLAANAGFQAPADAARARATAADGNSRLVQQRTQCALYRKALVALTGLDAATLDARLDAAPLVPPPLGEIAVGPLPAQTLAQRPDVFAAERAVAAASASAGAAQARRLPRLTLQGNIGITQFRVSGFQQSLDTWTIGPLALDIPIFDAGTRAANAEAARARYDESVAQYRSTVRQAVREVESALLSLQSSQDRHTDAQVAVDNSQRSFAATQARFDSGLASLFELEDARRQLFVAQTTLVGLQRERAEAFVTLYRAMGGGWQRPGSDGAPTVGAVPAASSSPSSAPATVSTAAAPAATTATTRP
ncbi:efflux transporter outer membrane subunit [Variovorax dokdonensis]|uniref:Efflux transporter outer membrane subunit n=1 Tax=Variovorax dokdonensis TaxID=344883 RepID=A0ABT7N896_9BURK|nr:efflux transporter outer membrane subunit [Variovorax dokdonensis]MDM0044160.1 efflux transporter outer membrane subunit [Variovorax dokdonensis]